jgi:predicted small secreted protein
MDSRKVITTLAIATLLAVSITAAGCTTNTSPSPTIGQSITSTGNNTTISSDAGFSITFPNNLKSDTSTNASEPVRVYIYVAPNNTVNGVVVATYPLQPNTALNVFVNYNKGQIIMQGYENYTEISNQSTTFAGKPAYNMVWQGTVPVQLNQTTTRNMTERVSQTFIINGNTGYVITYKTVPSDYDTYLAQAERIMNSFELT